MKSEVIDRIIKCEKIKVGELLIDVFNMNPYPNAKEYLLGFPQPRWWILRVMVWFWMMAVRALGRLAVINVFIVIKIIAYSVIYLFRLVKNKGDEFEGIRHRLFDNSLKLSILFISGYVYCFSILPIESAVIQELSEQITPMVENIEDKISDFHFSEAVELIKTMMKKNLTF